MIRLDDFTYVNRDHVTSLVDMRDGFTRVNTTSGRVEVKVPIEEVAQRLRRPAPSIGTQSKRSRSW